MRKLILKADGETIEVQFDVTTGRHKAGYRITGDYNNAARIRLGKGHSRASLRRQLFQELGHYAWKRAALPQYLSTETEELVVHELLYWVLVILQENPTLVTILMEHPGA